jgi:hypothetical protein
VRPIALRHLSCPKRRRLGPRSHLDLAKTGGRNLTAAHFQLGQHQTFGHLRPIA